MYDMRLDGVIIVYLYNWYTCTYMLCMHVCEWHLESYNNMFGMSVTCMYILIIWFTIRYNYVCILLCVMSPYSNYYTCSLCTLIFHMYNSCVRVYTGIQAFTFFSRIPLMLMMKLGKTLIVLRSVVVESQLFHWNKLYS